MLRRTKETHTPVQQIGPDREQIAEPTPVGDALERVLRYGEEAAELERRIDDVASEQRSMPQQNLRTEHLEQMASHARSLAGNAGKVALRGLPWSERRYWQQVARQLKMPRNRQ